MSPPGSVSRRQVQVCTGTILLFACAAALAIWPLLLGRTCHEFEADEDHIFLCLLAPGLAVAHRKLRQVESSVSIWTRRFAVSFLAHVACQLVWRWLLATCPVDSSAVLVLFDVTSFVAYTTYCWCQFCLAWLSVLRLEWISKAHQASQAARMLKLTVCVCLLAILLLTFARFVKDRRVQMLAYVPIVGSLCLFCAFQVRVFSAALQAGRQALREARRTGQHSEQAKAALLTAMAVALSSCSTIAAMMFAQVTVATQAHAKWPLLSWQWWLNQSLFAFDFGCDVLLAVVCSGLITAAAEQEVNFKIAGDLVEAARRRKVLSALKEAARAVTGPSVALAALFEGKDPEDLLETAVSKFRCISWETLRRHSYLVLGGDSLDGSRVSTDFYSLSEPCRLSHCDAFFSHSWHDDCQEKWRRLAEWCTEFSEAHGRAPYLWFDKVCIDQSDIQADLECLPIFLAGCNRLLICCGKTYVTRLWCCVELFVFMRMSEAGNGDHEIHVRPFGADGEEVDEVARAWATFDVHRCQCFKTDDKRRILDCIDNDRGATGFNEFIRSLAKGLFGGRTDRDVASDVTSDSDASLASI
eukprot:TRINITY_DN56057_c1_g2_i3.p1 TRINITY_DN56057_c1_g2~~TRINITY_DN56057_c1_g2_i3.p1  ORF type:complete len:584 (+),score=46.94 TRINITY_DN56057_c1_g2_i3:280-2031(+)